jgi:hypothetical protein
MTLINGAPAKIKVATVVFIVFIAIIAIALSINQKEPAPPSAVVINDTTSIAASTTIGIKAASCGPASYCINEPEAASLLGTGGAYNASTSTNLKLMPLALAYAPRNASGDLESNVTAWVVQYSVKGGKSQGGSANLALTEEVFRTGNVESLYAQMIHHSQNTYNVTNVTLDGMTYAYEGVSINGYNSTQFVGYRNSTITYLSVSGAVLNSTVLAGIVAEDMQ